MTYRGIAQLVEQRSPKPRAEGSSPSAPAIVSVFNCKGPPVPIPNTEVKLACAENTWLATARENKSTLTSKRTMQIVR